jgi:hypothetical protein
MDQSTVVFATFVCSTSVCKRRPFAKESVCEDVPWGVLVSAASVRLQNRRVVGPAYQLEIRLAMNKENE